jgi:hypothetical protein
MTEDNPFRFVWPVDQDGYTIEHVRCNQLVGIGNDREYDQIRPRGGPLRFYHPLEEDGLWLRFAETCNSAEGVLSFVGEFGLLTGLPERLDSLVGTATLIHWINEHLKSDNRMSALQVFLGSGLPRLKEAILWHEQRPEAFEFRLIPLTLRDALLHQAGEAITGKRRFRRCRNESCPNWFRLGPRANTGEGRRTYTARREFCSDRCRVAWARRHKKEGAANA